MKNSGTHRYIHHYGVTLRARGDGDPGELYVILVAGATAP